VSARATASVAVPGPNGTTTLTGFEGQVCAEAGDRQKDKAAMTRQRQDAWVFLSFFVCREAMRGLTIRQSASPR
jgi:hypothetical protein